MVGIRAHVTTIILIPLVVGNMQFGAGRLTAVKATTNLPLSHFNNRFLSYSPDGKNKGTQSLSYLPEVPARLNNPFIKQVYLRLCH